MSRATGVFESVMMMEGARLYLMYSCPHMPMSWFEPNRRYLSTSFVSIVVIARTETISAHNVCKAKGKAFSSCPSLWRSGLLCREHLEFSRRSRSYRCRRVSWISVVSVHWSLNLLIHEFFVEVFPTLVDIDFYHSPEQEDMAVNWNGCAVYFTYFQAFDA